MRLQGLPNKSILKIAKVIQAQDQIQRVAPGYYSFTNNYGTTGEIFRLDEGVWRGWWVVQIDRYNVSDPVRTLSEAKEIAYEWEADTGFY